MVRTLLVVLAIALGDSLNPSTVVPAVYLTVMPSAMRQVLEFSAGVFVAYFVCGLLLLLGPGQLLLGLLPHIHAHEKHELELAGGIVLIVVAFAVWLFRRRLAALPPPLSRGRRGSAFAAGATLMLAEFPTAFPYFGAIAVIVGSGEHLPVQIGLMVLFNLVFVAPLVAIGVVVGTVPGVRRKVLEPAAAWLTRQWPVLFASLALLLGIGGIVFGAVGLAKG